MKALSRGRWSRSTTLVAGMITVVVLVAVTGCSASNGAPDDAATTKITSTGPAASGPVDSVVWNLPAGEPASLDPRNAATFSGATVVSNLCDSLMTIDADYNVSPNLVEPEQVSDTELKLTVKSDVTFWDGSPVTAEDVAYSMQRSADPSALVSFIYANVSDITVTGGDEVTVTFSKPDEMFITEMTTFAGMVVKKDFAENVGETFGSSSGGLMCSGPFVFDKWTPGDSIIATKNPTYWNSEREPLAETVKFSFVTDSSAYTQAMRAGEIDGSYQITPSAIPALRDSGEGELFFGPSTESLVLSVANPGGTLGDQNLREAFQTLVDRATLAKVVYNGAATPLYTVVGSGQWQNDALDTYEKAAEPYAESRAYDLEKAKKSVAESDYDGTEIVLAVTAGDATLGRVAQLVQEQAKQAGIKVKILTMQPLDYTEAQYDASKRGGIDLFLGSSWSAIRDPLESTGFLFLPGGFYNQTNYDDPEVTTLIETARQTFDSQKRAELFTQAQEIFEKENTIVPLLTLNTVTYLKSGLGGAVTSFAYMTMPALTGIGSAD